uniref:Uncharacterized protein n=1 Tax=Brassica oleracea var. oleracea TaxID=109376 RepID=A0A0D3CS63_BRAOL
MHDPVKFVVSCAVFEADSPIPPDKGVHLSSYIDVLDDHQHAVTSQRGLRCRGEVDKNPGEAASIITDQIPSIDTNTSPSIDTTTSPSIDTTISYRHWKRIRAEGVRYGVRKSRVQSRCFSQPFAKLRALLIAEMIDKGEESMEEAFTQE